MLIIAEHLRELSFSGLMEVYEEGNRENGAEQFPDEPEMRRLQLAEGDFYRYLREIFFPTDGAKYAIWEVEGAYVSALRLEPYRDGLLLEALETAPGRRRKGYALALVQAVQARLGQGKLYSHVRRDNIPSQKLHERCGFRIISHTAVYIDGSVNPHADTLCYEP